MIKSLIFLLVLCLIDYFFQTVLSDVGDKAKAECKKYGEKMVECQRKLHGVKTRVPADILEYPHMALIGFNQSGEISYQCGGSLISPEWVLSAAHCVGDSRTGPPVRIRFGTTTLEDEEQEDGVVQERNVMEYIVHPEYKPPAKYNDIALLKLDEPIDKDGDVTIACLPVENIQNITKAMASGFGKTKFDNTDGSRRMMHVDLAIIPQKACGNSLKSMTRRGNTLKQGIIESQICAGDLTNGGKDTCQGDSGGPLQFLPQDPDCINSFNLHVIIGVTSFGRFCGFRNSPGVYTRVSFYTKWIEDIVWPDDKTTTKAIESTTTLSKLKFSERSNSGVTNSTPEVENNNIINQEEAEKNRFHEDDDPEQTTTVSDEITTEAQIEGTSTANEKTEKTPTAVSIDAATPQKETYIELSPISKLSDNVLSLSNDVLGEEFEEIKNNLGKHNSKGTTTPLPNNKKKKSKNGKSWVSNSLRPVNRYKGNISP